MCRLGGFLLKQLMLLLSMRGTSQRNTHISSTAKNTYLHTPETHTHTHTKRQTTRQLQQAPRFLKKIDFKDKSINSSPCFFSSHICRTHLEPSAACLHQQPSLTTADNHAARPLANQDRVAMVAGTHSRSHFSPPTVSAYSQHGEKDGKNKRQEDEKRDIERWEE